MGESMENEPPVLLVTHGDSNRLSYKLLENELRVVNIPILCDKVIMGSSYGWLVLANFATNECCLWNPISMETIELPQLHFFAYCHNICVLSKPPTEPDCHILFNSASNIIQSFCRIGDEEFVDSPCGVHILWALGSCKGKIYGFFYPGDLFVNIHFEGKNLEFRPMMIVDEPWRIPQLSPPSSKWCSVNMWLIESPQSSGTTNELLLVQKLYTYTYLNGGVDFKVFRIDTDLMKCVELDHIGERAIFLTHHGNGFCRRSSIKIKPNSIYYTNKRERDMYVFDLEDRSTTPLLPSRVEGPLLPRIALDKQVCSWVEHQLIFPKIII